MPKVSVCIPSYNLAAYLGEAIESVLNQSFTDFELLIEDDYSTDDSRNVMARYANDPRVKLMFSPENHGANGTTNRLVMRASGEYICLLAADDVWEKDKLAKQVAYLDSHPECGIVFGHPFFINSAGLPKIFPSYQHPINRSRQDWLAQFRCGNCVFISTSMYRHSLHGELGYFAVDLPILADMEFYTRIAEKHDIHIIEERLAKIRARDDNSNLSAPRDDVMVQAAYDMEKVHKRHFQPKVTKSRYMIATPFYESKGYAPYIDSLVKSCCALTVAGIDFDYVQLSGDSYVWRARNQIAEAFMESDCSHLIFIDSDEGWDLEGFLRLIKAEGDIVGAAYPVKNNWENFGVTIHCNEDMTPKVNKAGLIYAEKVPTGFMKISRKVFETLQESEPDNWYWDTVAGALKRRWNYFGHLMENHIVYGEDISFCRRWAKAGGELFVEPRVTIAHVGVKSWTGEYFDFLCRQPGGSREKKEAA